MKFEYDDNKSKINKKKHGIDFVEAQNLWQNKNALVVPLHSATVPCHYRVGKIDNMVTG